MAALALVSTACGTGEKYPELPDLATKSPSKQQVMSPAEQKAAMDALIAKRDQQTAEAAKQAAIEKARK